MSATFIQLNDGWNADPNSPEPNTSIVDKSVQLSFILNPYISKNTVLGNTAKLRFINCARYGFSHINDEGWYLGQCRFSKIAPKWGEFYQNTGDPLLETSEVEWIDTGFQGGSHHYLFYFRDTCFECFADDWYIERD
ncbi:hypothetical protein [Kordiimonas sp. SCSIO 12610]|uniref:hypothetical protein n=1 Tax=Kordiimonas sp. SCSIO 12610 TaxID=2829597 RepID=UPI002109EE1F|nr:hypothetical protein [Kordiimonas sp. SCSIO 12610]UTW56220.1 hypothetical protein KFF44_04790 [Kordiimonas sp. SCSIO 12610]